MKFSGNKPDEPSFRKRLLSSSDDEEASPFSQDSEKEDGDDDDVRTGGRFGSFKAIEVPTCSSESTAGCAGRSRHLEVIIVPC